MCKWGRAKKKPVEIKFREVTGEKEIVETREGKLVATKDKDFIIEGVEGEIYPITKTTFYKTYNIIKTVDGKYLKGYHNVEEFYKN